MKKLITTGAKITATKEGRKMAKEAFRKLFKKHKSEVRRTKKTKGYVPTIPYNLKKADLKKKIRGTKLTASAEFKAQPGLKRRIRVGIERAKRDKKKFRPPVIVGKAFASDKPGRTMQIQPLTIDQRRRMKKEMEESAKRLYRKMFLEKKKKGGLHTIKIIKRKLEKASAAHAGQAKALGKVIGKKKLLLGGLLTTGIKAAVKGLKKSGATTTKLQRKHMAKDIRDHRSRGFKTGYKTRDMSDLTKRKHRLDAKDDMRAGIKMRVKDKKDLSLIRASSYKGDNSKAQYVSDMLKSARSYYKKMN